MPHRKYSSLLYFLCDKRSRREQSYFEFLHSKTKSILFGLLFSVKTIKIMWQAVIKILTNLQRIRPVTLKYSKQNGVFQSNKSSYKILSGVLNFLAIITWVAAVIGLGTIFEDPTSENADAEKTVLISVVQVLNVGLYSQAMVAIWTFQYQLEEGIWMMNQAKQFSEIREQNSDKETKSNWKESTLFEIIAYNNCVVAAAGVITISATPLLSRSTPPHIILGWIYLEGTFDAALITVACCTYLLIVSIWVAVSILQVLIYICSILFESQFMLRTGYNSNWSMVKETTVKANFRKARLVYSQSFMFIQAYNSFGYWIFPSTMAAGFIINVISSFVCIRLSHSLSPTVLITFAAFDVATLIVTIGLHSFTMISSEESTRFQKFWREKMLSKVDRRWFTACKHIAVKIGPFFYMQRTTLLSTILEILNLIVSLLVM